MDPEPTHTHSVQEYLSVGLPVIYGSGCIITLASLYFICLLCSVQQLASALMQSKRRKNTSKIIFLLLLSLFLFARTFLLVVPLPISSFVVFQLVGVEIPVFILFVTWQTLALWFSNSFRSSKVQSNMPCRRFLFAFFFISIFGLFIAFFIQTLISSHHQHDTGAQDYDKSELIFTTSALFLIVLSILYYSVNLVLRILKTLKQIEISIENEEINTNQYQKQNNQWNNEYNQSQIYSNEYDNTNNHDQYSTSSSLYQPTTITTNPKQNSQMSNFPQSKTINALLEVKHSFKWRLNLLILMVSVLFITFVFRFCYNLFYLCGINVIQKSLSKLIDDSVQNDARWGKYYAAYLAFYFVQEIIPSATLLFTFMILSISSPQQPSSNQSSNHDQNNDYSSSSEQNADHTFIEYNQQQHTTYNALESTPLRALPHQQTRSNSQQQQQNSHHNSIKQSKRSQKQPYNYNSSKQPHDQDQEDTNGSTTSKGTTISSSDSGTDFYYDSVSAYQQFLNLYQFSENIEGFIYPDMVDEQSLAKDVELDEEGEKERHRKRRKPHKISSSSHSKSGKSHRKRVQEDL